MTMIWSTAGIALGFFMGWLAFGWEPSGFDSTGLFVTLAVALTVVPWCSLFDAHSYYPGEGEDKELRLQITSEGVPLSVEQAKVDDESYLDFHHRKCAAIAEEIGLTKRQEEVLELLAKGRNSSYIQQDLVISPHTVKSHTYSIYQKAGVHSQQELMDLVEDYKL
jgi:DNA-binding CsgD family transcriptional regulator